MKLKNPTSKDIEFYYAGRPYVIEANSVRNVDEKVADHCLRFINSALVQAEDEPEPKVKVVKYEDVPWDELKGIAKNKGINLFGMKRDEIIEALRNSSN